MAKTLADMTAEERAECVGMWASHQGHEDKDEPCGNLGIISEIDRDYAWIAFPKESAETYVFDLEDLIPRYDLRPAWSSKGEPFPLPALTKRSRKREPINASEVQGILGTDWLEGKTPEELVREHREGME